MNLLQTRKQIACISIRNLSTRLLLVYISIYISQTDIFYMSWIEGTLLSSIPWWLIAFGTFMDCVPHVVFHAKNFSFVLFAWYTFIPFVSTKESLLLLPSLVMNKLQKWIYLTLAKRQTHYLIKTLSILFISKDEWHSKNINNCPVIKRFQFVCHANLMCL